MDNRLNHQPGVIALIKYDSGKKLELTEGYEDINSNVPINGESIFDIASLSKQFTAFSLLLLERDSNLCLNDRIHDYLPNLGSYANGITIQNLLHHTSGLPCIFDIASAKNIDYLSKFTPSDMIKGLNDLNLTHFTPGTKYEYSNTGYILLAKIVENVSGQYFSDFINKEIFIPLGMKNSFISNGISMAKKPVTGYEMDTQGSFVISSSPWDVTGAGLVHSSANDLMKWGANFSTGTIGGKELIKKMLTPLPKKLAKGENIEDYVPYCFGIEYENNELGENYCHQGSTFGRESYFIRSQHKGFTLVVLSNIESFNIISIANKLYAAINSIDN